MYGFSFERRMSCVHITVSCEAQLLSGSDLIFDFHYYLITLILNAKKLYLVIENDILVDLFGFAICCALLDVLFFELIGNEYRVISINFRI